MKKSSQDIRRNHQKLLSHLSGSLRHSQLVVIHGVTCELHQNPGMQAEVQWPPKAKPVGSSQMGHLAPPTGNCSRGAGAGAGPGGPGSSQPQFALPAAPELQQHENEKQSCVLLVQGLCVRSLGKEDGPQCSRVICHHFLGANYKPETRTSPILDSPPRTADSWQRLLSV